MPSRHSMTWKDKEGQKASSRVNVSNLTAANFDAVNTQLGALRTAIEAFSLGNLQGYTITANDVAVSDGAASSLVARRELKLFLQYEDATTHDLYGTEIPCPDLENSDLWSNAVSGKVDKASTEWGDLVTAFEAVVKSKDGNAVLLRDGWIVGRNL